MRIDPKPFIILLVFIFSNFLSAQEDIQVGNQGRIGNSSGALYDYSSPSEVNFRVQIWGYANLPGFYIVPAGTSLNELISLAGGPTEDALLNDIRIVKMKEGYQTTMTKYNYNDLVWEKNITNQISYVRLDAGDIVVIPGEPRYFTREDITFYLSVLTALASTTALIMSIIYISN